MQQLQCTLQVVIVYSKQLEAQLQEVLQENECLKVRCQGLELNIQQRDRNLEDLRVKLEEKERCNLRVETLEEALSAKESETQIKLHSMLQMNPLLGNNFAAFGRENRLQV